MATDAELTVNADSTQARQAPTRLRRAMDAALYRDAWARTHCTVALARTGRGVAHDPACTAGPIRVRYTDAAADAINPKRERMGT